MVPVILDQPRSDPRMTGRLMLIGLLSAGNFVIGMGAFVVIGMLSPIADGLGISSSGGPGCVLTVYALAYAVALAAGGRR